MLGIEEIPKDFDFAEIYIEPPAGMPEVLAKNTSHLKDLMKKRNIFGIAHFPYWAEFGASYSNIRQAWVDVAKSAMQCCHNLEIHRLTFHLNFQGMVLERDEPRQRAIRCAVDSVRHLVTFGRKLSVELILEIPEVNKHFSASDYLLLIEQLPGISVAVDVGHAFLSGGMELVREFLLSSGSDCRHIHIHDNEGTGDDHLELGRGKLDVRAVAQTLREIGFDNTITFEVFHPDRFAIQRSLKLFKETWSNA